MITYPVVQHESISCVPPQMKVSPSQWPSPPQKKMKTPEPPSLQTGGQTNVLQQHCPRYTYASRSTKGPKTSQSVSHIISVWTVVQTVLTATFNSYGNRQISIPHKINTSKPIDKNFDTVDYVREGPNLVEIHELGASGQIAEI